MAVTKSPRPTEESNLDSTLAMFLVFAGSIQLDVMSGFCLHTIGLLRRDSNPIAVVSNMTLLWRGLAY